MNVLVGTDAQVTIDLLNSTTRLKDTRIETVANVTGVRVIDPEGAAVQVEGYTVPSPGVLSFQYRPLTAGVYEVVARLSLAGREASSHPFYFRADPSNYAT